MHPVQEQERVAFQNEVDSQADGGTLKLRPLEYPGPVLVNHPIVIEGSGSTIWALHGPVISCQADAVTLRNLRIEVTGVSGAKGDDQCALKIDPGCGVTFENVEVRGSVSGHWQEEGDWHYPYSLQIGSVPFSSELDLLLRVWVPVPCEISSKISGLLVQPQKLEPGANEITLHIERIPKDTLLNGILTLTTANLKRSISLSGYISSTRSRKTRSKKTVPVAWQPEDWEALVAAGRPPLPVPPPYVAPPARISRSKPIAPPPATASSPPLPGPPVQPPVEPPVVQSMPPLVVQKPVPPPVSQPPVSLPQPPPPSQSKPKPGNRLTAMILVAGAVVVLLLTAGLAYWLFFSAAPFDPDKMKARSLSLASEALSVSFSADGSLLASGTKGGAIELWTVASGEHAAQQLGKQEKAINSVAFSHAGNLLATGGSDFYVIIWDVYAGDKTKEQLQDEVNVVAFSPDDAILACGSKDGTVRFLDQNGRPQPIRLTHGSPVLAVAFSADGKLVATGAEDGTVKIWEVSTGAMKQRLDPRHEGPVLGVAFAKTTANVNLLATAGADRKLILWDLPGGQMKSPSPFLHTDQVTSVVFSPDDKFVLTGGGGKDTTLRFFKTDGSSGPPIVKVDHSGPISAVAVSSRGVVATGSSDRTVRLWATP